MRLQASGFRFQVFGLLLAACGGATLRPAAPKAGAVDWGKAKVGWSQPPKAGPEPAFAPPVPETFTLDNGVQVLLVEIDRLPLVSVRVVMSRAGGHEDGAQTGLASFTADLLDQGAGD